ncbi:hypothetical protein RRG08_002334 [Elysia crispata]|uniref:Uncharacterized protein n=1 Tax=Elysia crispata TaxID=231223 RepID=A0AAE0ZB31_9GAST|nr:hypothetical protein RRG08_002334 [Elysia crispata]
MSVNATRVDIRLDIYQGRETKDSLRWWQMCRGRAKQHLTSTSVLEYNAEHFERGNLRFF